jgi:membrane protein
VRRTLLLLAGMAGALAVRRSAAAGHPDTPVAAIPATTPDRGGRRTAGAVVVDLTDPTDDPRGATGDPAGDAAGDPVGHLADTPTEIPRPGWAAVLKRTRAEVKADRVPMMAAAVAFAGLLALFPAIIAAISIYGLVTDPSSAAEAAGELTAAMPAEAAGIITDQLQSVASAEESTLGLTLLVAILGALWSASGGVGMLINALNVAYDEEDTRTFLRARGLALAMTLGAIVFFAVAVTLIAVVPAVIDGIGLGIVGTVLAQVARWVLLAALLAGALAVLYRFAPHRADARWRWLSPGAVVATVLWLLGSLAFSAFVSNFGSYNETYGTIAGVIVLMLWLQISALVVLFGAELNAEVERQTAKDTTTGPPRPIGLRGAQPADDLPPPAGEGDAAVEARAEAGAPR